MRKRPPKQPVYEILYRQAALQEAKHAAARRSQEAAQLQARPLNH